MKKIVIIISMIMMLLTILSCSENYKRHYQLGKWYYDKGLTNEAILEFKAAAKSKPDNYEAHSSLAIAYTKKEWYDYALKEAEIAFDLHPSDDNYNLIQVIKQKRMLGQIEAVETPQQ